jgi:hypothetical protein
LSLCLRQIATSLALASDWNGAKHADYFAEDYSGRFGGCDRRFGAGQPTDAAGLMREHFT